MSKWIFQSIWVRSLYLAMLFIGLSFAVPVPSVALPPYQWSTPRQIPEYYDLLEPPQMVSDQNRTVHAFNMETMDNGGFAIMYRRWSLEQGWSSPVDVILPTYMGVAPDLLDVILDADGYFHLVFFGGTQQDNAIYYTSVLARDAENSNRWQKPVIVTSEAGPLASAQLLRNKDGTLIMVYAGSRYGSGLYETHMPTSSSSWSKPLLIQRSSNENLNPGAIRMTQDDQGRLHIVWHMDDISGLAKETWYVRMDSSLWNFTDMEKISQSDDELEFNGQPSLAFLHDKLFVVYYDDYPPTRFMRSSSDFGESWTSPIRLFPHRGGYGPASLVVDSLGTLHLLVGNRLQNPEIHGMWYSRFEGNAWLPLDPIISGPATDTFDPTRPEAVIVQGNILLVAWSNDVREEFRSPAWYSYTFLDAPELSVQPLPSASQLETPESSSGQPIIDTTTELSSSTIVRVSSGYKSPDRLDSLSGNPASLIFIGVFPVMILVAVALVRRMGQR
jgi:hypothetical protein